MLIETSDEHTARFRPTINVQLEMEPPGGATYAEVDAVHAAVCFEVEEHPMPFFGVSVDTLQPWEGCAMGGACRPRQPWRYPERVRQ